MCSWFSVITKIYDVSMNSERNIQKYVKYYLYFSFRELIYSFILHTQLFPYIESSLFPSIAALNSLVFIFSNLSWCYACWTISNEFNVDFSYSRVFEKHFSLLNGEIGISNESQNKPTSVRICFDYSNIKKKSKQGFFCCFIWV